MRKIAKAGIGISGVAATVLLAVLSLFTVLVSEAGGQPPPYPPLRVQDSSGTPTGKPRVLQFTGCTVSYTGNVVTVSSCGSSVVPYTPPSAGQILVGNAGGTAYAPVTVSGSCTMASTGALTCSGSGLSNPLAAGSVGTNALQVVQTGTGLYQPTTNVLGIAANGVDVLRANTTASGVNYVTVTPSATGTGLAATRVEIAAAGSDTQVSLSLLPKGTSNATQGRVLFGANGGFTLWGDGDWQIGNNAGNGFTALRFNNAFTLSAATSSTFTIKDSANSGTWLALNSTTETRNDGNGGSEACQFSSENLALSTSGTTTDTSASLVPANSYIKWITYRISTTITTATAFTVKVKGGNSFSTIGTATTSQSTLTSGTRVVLVPSAYADQYNSAAAKLTVDTTGTPGAGAMRLTVLACAVTAPTS